MQLCVGFLLIYLQLNRKAIYGLLIALIIPLGIFLYVNSLPKAAVPKPLFYDSVSSRVEKGKQVNDTSWHHIPDFSLTNQLGRKVSLSDISLNDSGRIIIANFFFTHCQNICPGMTAAMKKLQAGIHKSMNVGESSPEFLQFISFTIDPERDSVAALKNWADRFQADPTNWWFLTGDKKTIYDLSLNHLKLSLQDPRVDSAFPHTDIFVLIDKYGVVRARRDQYGNPLLYHSGDSVAMRNLAEDVILLSLEKDPKRISFLGGQLHIIAVAMLTTLILVGIFLYLFRKTPNKHEAPSNLENK
jgi:protein SCO1